MTGDVPEAVLAMWLTRLSRLNVAALEDRALADGMTSSEVVVLASLWVTGPPHVQSPTRLGDVVIQSPGGLTKTLRRLETAGLVDRIPDPDDGRGLLVRLTPPGIDAAQRALGRTMVHYEVLLSGLPPADRQDLARLVRALLDQLEASTGHGSTAMLADPFAAGPG